MDTLKGIGEFIAAAVMLLLIMGLIAYLKDQTAKQEYRRRNKR